MKQRQVPQVEQIDPGVSAGYYCWTEPYAVKRPVTEDDDESREREAESMERAFEQRLLEHF